mgnify:CR=1 FL=1
MPERIHCYRNEQSRERPWRLDIDDRTIDFRREDEALRAARMIAGPGRLLVIDRRTSQERNLNSAHITAKGD